MTKNTNLKITTRGMKTSYLGLTSEQTWTRPTINDYIG